MATTAEKVQATAKMLDVGGRHGKWWWIAGSYDCSAMDIRPDAIASGVVIGDVDVGMPGPRGMGDRPIDRYVMWDTAFRHIHRRSELMAESVYKIIELVGTSSESWERAASAAIERAAGSLRDLRIAEVAELDLVLDNGVITAYRARVKVSFKYENAND